MYNIHSWFCQVCVLVDHIGNLKEVINSTLEVD